MTHREIAARAAIAIYALPDVISKESSVLGGIAFADTFERIYAERCPKETWEPAVTKFMEEEKNANLVPTPPISKDPKPTPAPEGAVELVRELLHWLKALHMVGDDIYEITSKSEAWLSRQPTGPTREELIEALEVVVDRLDRHQSEVESVKNAVEVLRRAKEQGNG